ncbi:MAG: hypothetical protein M0Z61_06640 [Nitrospiraceae bacterium]|nr:hypothetical protein [Nitrospiraceae bacterium]
MSRLAMIIIYFALAFFSLIAAISMHRYKKGLTSAEHARLSHGTYPWWYYVGLIIPAIIFLGSFGDEIKLIGFILFFIIFGLGWKWKLKQNK